MKKILLTLLLVVSYILTNAQIPEATHAQKRLKAFELRQKMKENSPVKNVEFRNVGPVVMSGRVVDLDVNPSDPTEFYVAYASGGLWHTHNNGITFTPVFDDQAVMTLGDIAVDWENQILWAGTGENNSSRSSYSGTGIYKSSDKGKTWQHMGLPETHHTGRIILHPENPDVLWVAAIGHLYSSNEERGVFKSIDGGKTWKKTLYIDENTGVIDLIINPDNPDVLYATAWTRTRRAWNFTEAGEGSGIYRSTDGGNSWDKISGEDSGFPEGEGVGRIGLDIYPGNTEIIYAFLDNQFHMEKKEEDTDELTKKDLKTMTKEEFLKLPEDKIEHFLKENDFPRDYDVKTVIRMVKDDEIEPKALAFYLEDENTLLFDTPVIGGELYRSNDGGKTWKKTHEKQLEGLVYTYGYYFGEVRISPFDPDEVYLLGVPLIMSKDGGKTFRALSSENMHADHHAFWINPQKEGHLIGGNDGGVNISYDKGETWYKANVPPVGQFYSVNFDKAKPYHVYGGLQDNGVWYGPSTYNPENAWHYRGRDEYKSIGGGDGMQVEIDWRNNQIVYSGSQFGYYYRYNKETGDRMPIKPRHKLGERPLRFNWETPIYLSRHNQDILYYGANKLFRSLDQGENLEVISPDLTNGGKKGNVSYGTLTTIHESPLQFGLIYTGSDDGAVYVTKDGGHTWTEISAGLPENMWVSQVYASHHEKERVYVSLNGYRWDHFDPYVFVSEDFGKTWNSISAGLPAEPVNVVKEDPHNENIIYVGTDHSGYYSSDRGQSYRVFDKGLPDAPVHDLAVHPDEKDLILGTHGRSIFVGDLEEIYSLDTIQNKTVFVYDVKKEKKSPYWGRKWNDFYPALEPKTEITWYSANQADAVITIESAEGLALKEIKVSTDKGLNYQDYDFSVNDKLLKKAARENEKLQEWKAADNGVTYLSKGEYIVRITIAGNEAVGDLIVE